MKYETIEKLEKLACKELDEIANNGLNSASTIQNAKNLVSMCHKLCDMKEGGYSGDGNWYAMGDYSRSGGDGYGGRTYSDRSYRDGMSGARGRSMTSGRYMSRAMGKDQMAQSLEEMLAEGGMDPEIEREAERFMGMLRR